ncbi:MAG: hypothetical protein RR199_06065, partial [Alistipes sp.]
MDGWIKAHRVVSAFKIAYIHNIIYHLHQMKTLKYIFRFIVIGAVLSILPYWVAVSLDLNVIAFIATFDFIMLMIIASARDH